MRRARYRGNAADHHHHGKQRQHEPAQNRVQVRPLRLF